MSEKVKPTDDDPMICVECGKETTVSILGLCQKCWEADE